MPGHSSNRFLPVSVNTPMSPQFLYLPSNLYSNIIIWIKQKQAWTVTHWLPGIDYRVATGIKFEIDKTIFTCFE